MSCLDIWRLGGLKLSRTDGCLFVTAFVITRHLAYVSQSQGMNLRIGRFISVPGIEAQLAPNNYIFSHSLLHAIDPFTDTGLIATAKLNDRWLVQLGITGGHDVALWTPDAKPSGTGCLSYTTNSVNDNFYLCVNGINDGKYAYNNLQQYDVTGITSFRKRCISQPTWYMYERDVAALGGKIQPETGANAAYCLTGNSVAQLPNMRWSLFCRRNSQRMTSCRFAVTFSTTKRPAYGLRDPILREHDHVVSLGRDNCPATSGIAFRACLGSEGVRQRSTA